jgi:hypothetical protein
LEEDNLPYVFIAPSVIAQLIKSAEDYSSKYIAASFVRILRFIGLNTTLILQSLYVAIFTYHHEMIPTELLKTISQAREQLPMPIFLEMLLFDIAFELLREAGLVGGYVKNVGRISGGQLIFLILCFLFIPYLYYTDFHF